MAADPAMAGEIGKPMTEWVDFVADIVRRGQADGDLRPELDPRDVAVVLVSAFDGLKTLTDVLNPGTEASQLFTQRAATLLTMINHGLLVKPTT
jgi:hypothetical protein